MRTLFLSKDSLHTITFKCPNGSEFMNSTTCRFDEIGLFRTKELVRPVPIEDSDFGSVGKVHRKQHLYECKFVIGYTLGWCAHPIPYTTYWQSCNLNAWCRYECVRRRLLDKSIAIGGCTLNSILNRDPIHIWNTWNVINAMQQIVEMNNNKVLSRPWNFRFWSVVH